MNRLKIFNLILSALFSLLVAAILGLFIWGFIVISDSQSVLTENIYRIEKVDESEKNLSTLKKRLEEISDFIPNIDTALPSDKNSSLLVSDLDTLARNSGIKLASIQSELTGKRKSVTDLSLLQTVKGKYSYEIPLEIKVEGSFNSLSDFIGKIESYQRLLNITSLDITKVNTTGDNTDSIEAKIKLTAYLKK